MRKRIDDLGRVVVPAKFKKELNLQNGDFIEMVLENRRIVLSPIETKCVVCGSPLTEKRVISLCDMCIEKIKQDY